MSTIVALVIWSAILAKTARHAVPLADVRLIPIQTDAPTSQEPAITFDDSPVAQADAAPQMGPPAPVTDNPFAFDASVRWFNGRPVKPAKQMWMTVTAYSPDSRSCGTSDDGMTATMHSVETNGFRLVAADPTILPYGTMLSIDGYDKGQVVPVLDCGSAIKGHRLDVLFPSHEQARSWGVRKIKVTVWKYADGKAAENPRRVR
ncbi:MAG: 3D domain-containing protein [Planctomycetes bacterium]|nr:3D domain-containing protein [Planctomycetota bacterium]